MVAVSTERAIGGRGTLEAAWQAWAPLRALPACRLDALVPPAARAVVVAPHPDDEVLPCGGLLAMLAARGSQPLVIAVTDGDASHPGSSAWPAPRLALRRQSESLEGLRRLGLRHPDRLRVRLAFTDGQVARDRAALTDGLRALLVPHDVVFSPWVLDGHPDHEATAQATADACAAVGCQHRELPIWMWHWAAPGDARVPWPRLRRLMLTDDAWQRKLHAVEAHASQLETQDSGRAPVLTPAALQRWLRPSEYLLLP